VTQEDQDALVGRTVRELRDVNEKLAALRARASEFAESFSTVEHHLRNRLEFLRLDRETTDTRFVEQRDQRGAYGRQLEPHIPTIDTLDIKVVLAMRDEIRTCVLRIEQLETSLASMGFKDR
jgi:hypothetical protein